MRKKILLKCIIYCPSNRLRVFIYRSFFNYKIGKNTYIGKSIINAQQVQIGNNVVIKHNNSISCKQLEVGDNTKIHSGNTIIGKANFSIGENSRIINNHFIDVWNDVTIGNNTWLAGRDSQLWTHGSIHTKTERKDLSIRIGNDIYIGSDVNIAPGVVIGDNNLIGLGSVVTSSFPTSRSIIAGNPSKVIKENIDWRENW